MFEIWLDLNYFGNAKGLLLVISAFEWDTSRFYDPLTQGFIFPFYRKEY